MNSPVSEPILLTDDDRLLTAVGRAAAAASVQPQVHRSVRSVLGVWSAAPLVLIGADRLTELVELAVPRRAQVFVVCAAPPDQAILRDALLCGSAGLLELPADEARLGDLLTDTADGHAWTGSVIGVVGGTGGAGASTFAAALGLTVAHTMGSALLIDTDAAGGGADQILGLLPGDGVRWDALAQASGRLSARSLHETLPVVAGLSVATWSADRGAGLSVPALRAVLSAGRRGHPVVVVDLPRADPKVLEEVVPRCDQVIVVCTCTVPALAACLQLVARVPDPGTSVLLRGRSSFDTGEIQRLLGLPVLDRMADQRGLDEAVALGLGPLRHGRGSLARAADRVVDRLGLGRGR